VPGRADGNWSWRYDPAALSAGVAERLRTATTTFGRSPRFVMKSRD